MRKNDQPHRRAWKRHYGRFPRCGYHLHHVDGDSNNNSVSNLVELTPQQHFEVHYHQQDWYACIKLSSAAKVTPELLADIQRRHGRRCFEKKLGIHDPSFDKAANTKRMWKENPPGRKPVTNGIATIKLRTEEDVRAFLETNTEWRKGLPPSSKIGLRLSKRRIDTEEAKELAATRLARGTHNFTQPLICPHCNTQGKGSVMNRWHFNNCKKYTK